VSISEDDVFDREPPVIICPIGNRENCKHFWYERTGRHARGLSIYAINDDSEYYCEHPDLDDEIKGEYCPIMADDMMEDAEGCPTYEGDTDDESDWD
jgi:hypothetical protein